MSENKNDRVEETEHSPENRDEGSEEYLYQTAGIRERNGYIPVWLILVAVGLLIWGGYYLLSYWSPAS